MREVKELYFSEDHEWISVEDDVAYIGISDFAQKELGDIVYVELPDVDDILSQGDEFGAIESVKAASDIYMPVGGKILEVNTELDDDPSLINEDAYENWIIKIQITDFVELEALLNYEQYKSFCESD